MVANARGQALIDEEGVWTENGTGLLGSAGISESDDDCGRDDWSGSEDGESMDDEWYEDRGE